VVLTCLLTGTAYSERPPSKPYKICPEYVTAKDTPCRRLGPEATIAVRPIIAEDPKDKYIETLKERIRKLEELLARTQEKGD